MTPPEEPSPWPAPSPFATRVSRTFIRPLTDFLHKEASAGLLMIAAAFIAIVWANTPWFESYFDLWNTDAVIGIGGHDIELTLREWINDAAMVVFFFVVGLEIKRELTEGELRDPRQAALPIIGALGGMIAPAIIFYSLNSSGEAGDGWGIPMATDIAIVMGVVALIGTRAPSWLKLFLLALAIVDDIGAIAVIAIFYSEGVSFAWLALAIGTIAAAAILKPIVPYTSVYVALGIVCWLGLHQANVHPTLAGVAFGLLAPVTPRRHSHLVDADQLAVNPTGANARRVARQAKSTVSTVEWLEHILHPYTAFLIVPVFALSNAGIHLPSAEIGAALTGSVTWGVILGLVVGKTVGIASFTLLAVATRIGRLPEGVTTRYVFGAAALGGIGFTVSLFVTELAFGESMIGTDARLGVLIGSILAGVLGSAILLPGKIVNDRSMDEAHDAGAENGLEHVDTASSAHG